jgi:hypothetical protein
MQPAERLKLSMQALVDSKAGALTALTRRRVGMGCIHVIGGQDNDELSVEIFRDGQWQARPTLSEARVWSCAAAIDGAVYVMGGMPLNVNDDFETGSSVQVLRDGRWEAGPPMSTARRGNTRAVVLDGAIYVMGGEDVNGTDVSSVDIFRDGRWQAGPPMSTGRPGGCAEVLDGAIYVMCGFDGVRNLDTMEILRDGAWHAGGATHERHADPCLLRVLRWCDLRDRG